MKILAGILSIVAGVVVGYSEGCSPLVGGFYSAVLYIILRKID